MKNKKTMSAFVVALLLVTIFVGTISQASTIKTCVKEIQKLDTEVKPLSSPPPMIFCTIDGSGMKKNGFYLTFDQVTVTAKFNGPYSGTNVRLIAIGLRNQRGDSNNYHAEATVVMIMSGNSNGGNRAPSKPSVSFEDWPWDDNNMINAHESILWKFQSSDPDGDKIKFEYSFSPGRSGTTDWTDGVGGTTTSWDQPGLTVTMSVTAIDVNGAKSTPYTNRFIVNP